MSGFKINREGIRQMTRELEREFAKHPVRVPIEVDSQGDTWPLRSATTVNNYHGPVVTVNGDGTQLAWNSTSVHQSHERVEQVAAGYEDLAQIITDLLANVDRLFAHPSRRGGSPSQRRCRAPAGDYRRPGSGRDPTSRHDDQGTSRPRMRRRRRRGHRSDRRAGERGHRRHRTRPALLTGARSRVSNDCPVRRASANRCYTGDSGHPTRGSSGVFMGRSPWGN